MRIERAGVGSRMSLSRRGVAHDKIPAIVFVTILAIPVPDLFAHVTPQVIPLVPQASNSTQQGFIRVVNRTNRSGSVSILAIDDDGAHFGPVSLSLAPKEVSHFNSNDLEQGNSSKGLSGGVGDGEGNWRLRLESDLDFEALAYIRTGNSFVTSMHDIVAEDPEGRHRVPFFNPGSNHQQQSRLRLINPGPVDAEVTITGFDDDGMPPPEGVVRLSLPAGEARMITAQELEFGDEELAGRLGDGTGKWTLFVSAPHSIQVMNLLLSEDGNLSNLSRTPYEAHHTQTPEDCDDELVVVGDDDGHGTFDTAISIGDLTEIATVRARAGTVDSAVSENGYYRFTLDDTRTIRVELRNLTRNADLYLLNSLGEGIVFGDRDLSRSGGTLDELVVLTLDAGTYFIRVRASVNGEIGYQLRYSNDSRVPGRTLPSAFDLGDLSDVALVRTLEGRINAVRNETCRFRRAFYRFTLNDTRTIRVELRNLTGNADVYLLNSLGEGIVFGDRDLSRNGGTLDELVMLTLDVGTYFIKVEAATDSTRDIGYELRYSNDSRVPGRTIMSAFGLGDLTDVTAARVRVGEINAARNETTLFRRAFYHFTLDDTRTIRVELRNLTGNADLYLLNSLGEGIVFGDRDLSRNDGTLDEVVVLTLDAGTYFIKVEAATNSTRTIGYELRYGP